MTVIGVFGPTDDDEVHALADRLRARQVDAWVVDLSTFPAALHLARTADTFEVDLDRCEDRDHQISEGSQNEARCVTESRWRVKQNRVRLHRFRDFGK